MSAPLAWRAAAEAFLGGLGNDICRGDVERLLRDPAMAGFWRGTDAALQTSPRVRAGDFPWIRQTIVRELAFKGGRLPEEPQGAIRKRRRRLAARIRRLVRDLDAENPRMLRQPLARLPGLNGSGTVSDVLERFSRALEEGMPLGVLDPIERIDLMPQPGRESAQQLLLERTLCRDFTSFTGGPQYELVALAVQNALQIEHVEPADVGARWRNFLG